MAKLSVARINYIIANINDFDPLMYINTTEVKTPSRVHFSVILGMKARKLTLPDKTLWSNRTIYLKTTSTNLGI